MTVETAAAKATAKTIALLVLIVIVLIAAGVAWWHWEDYQALKAYKAEADSVSNVTSTATDAASQATQATQEVVVTVRQERAASDQAFQELRQNDQTVNQWADMPIPQRVRDLDGGSVNRSENHPAGSGKPDSDN